MISGYRRLLNIRTGLQKRGRESAKPLWRLRQARIPRGCRQSCNRCNKFSPIHEYYFGQKMRPPAFNSNRNKQPRPAGAENNPSPQNATTMIYQMANFAVKRASSMRFTDVCNRGRTRQRGFVCLGRKAQGHPGMEGNAESARSRDSRFGRSPDYASADSYSVALVAPVEIPPSTRSV